MTPASGGRAVGEWTAAAAVIYSLTLAAGAGYVFYASIRPVTIPTGYFAELADYPWLLAFLVLLAVWVAGPLVPAGPWFGRLSAARSVAGGGLPVAG